MARARKLDRDATRRRAPATLGLALHMLVVLATACAVYGGDAGSTGTSEVDGPGQSEHPGDPGATTAAGSSSGESPEDSSGPASGDSSTTGAGTSEDRGTTSTTGVGTTSTDGNDSTIPGCGDGTISPGEQCDGEELQGFDCNSLGLNGGVLSCDPITCTFDTSMCTSTSGGTSG